MFSTNSCRNIPRVPAWGSVRLASQNGSIPFIQPAGNAVLLSDLPVAPARSGGAFDMNRGKSELPGNEATSMDLPSDYAELLSSVKERVRSAQYAALKAVNVELVSLYWDIGRMIVERQKGETWGKSIVEQLAGDLRRKFPGVGGFSASNLWRMKGFYETYRDAEKLAPLVREIGWSHNLVILERCPTRWNESSTSA